MTLTDLSVAAERLKFLHKVVKREVKHFQTTDARLFVEPLTLELVQQLEVDEELAERVEAFISRFGRLQDTLGDKLLPQLLVLLGEKAGVAIDNFDRAERLGWKSPPLHGWKCASSETRWCMNILMTWLYWSMH